jgi:hypothetical protein
MKKFDWFTMLGMLAIAENTIFMVAQGGWWIIVGLMFGGIFALAGYWDWRRYQTLKDDQKASCSITEAQSDAYSESVAHRNEVLARRQIADTYIASLRGQAANDIQAMSDVFRRLGSSGVTIDEFSSALNNACREPHSIGDVGCKWNARSPYIRCAINPSGECQGCKDYEPNSDNSI